MCLLHSLCSIIPPAMCYLQFPHWYCLYTCAPKSFSLLFRFPRIKILHFALSLSLLALCVVCAQRWTYIFIYYFFLLLLFAILPFPIRIAFVFLWALQRFALVCYILFWCNLSLSTNRITPSIPVRAFRCDYDNNNDLTNVRFTPNNKIEIGNETSQQNGSVRLGFGIYQIVNVTEEQQNASFNAHGLQFEQCQWAGCTCAHFVIGIES